jgi:polyhydroxybutyrate depolymerase
MGRPAAWLALLALWALAQARAAAETIIADGRPAALHVPTGYRAGTPAPLVILLHGYSASAAIQEAYFAFTPLSDQYGFLYLMPDGTINCVSNRFWNATDACCNFCGSTVDDSGYVLHLIQATEALYSVDRGRVYLIGHSNGGFMAYRAACDHADRIAALVSLAGATFQDPAACTPSEPVHTLQIHGTSDGSILYGGGLIAGRPYPGAVRTAELWAGYDGCSLVPDTSAPDLDLDASLAGAETKVARYTAACMAGGSAELWTIQGGTHIPSISAAFRPAVIEYLLRHPKADASAVPLLPALAGLALALALLALLARSIGSRPSLADQAFRAGR